MAEPISTSGALKELLKEPVFYAIAIVIATGGYLMKGSEVGATWYFGAGIIIFGLVFLVVKTIQSSLDSSFKRKYNEVIVAQSSAIKSQKSVIAELSKNTIAAHANMTSVPELSGDYTKDVTSATLTK